MLGLSTTSIAASKVPEDYDSGYYESEGRIHFKGRILGAISRGNQKGLPQPTSTKGKAAPQKNGHFVANGFGVEGATTLFFGDHIAAELGLGLTVYKVSTTALNAISYNYGNGNTLSKSRRIYAIPATFTMQYHIAPFGAIRPYVGAGYSGTYFLSRAKEFNLKNTHGAVGQFGVDFVMTNDMTLNIDIKKYSLAPKLTYKRNVMGTSLSSKAKIDPWVIAVGAGFKF